VNQTRPWTDAKNRTVPKPSAMVSQTSSVAVRVDCPAAARRRRVAKASGKISAAHRTVGRVSLPARPPSAAPGSMITDGSGGNDT
jgi:hypothetical protein